MNLFKSNKQHVSKTEMENYLTNSLSEEEKNSIEIAMQNDPFLEDAMEGYAQFPNEINNVPSYKKGNVKGYLIGGLAVLFFLLGVFLFINNQNTTSKFTPRNARFLVENKTDIPTIENTTTSKENTLENEQKPTPAVEQNKVKKENETVTLVRETVSLEKYEASPEIYQQEQNYDIKKIKIKTIGYYNFLAVDYSVIYTNEVPFEEIEIGTPASQSNSETYNLNEDNKINKTLKFTYKEYLKKSLKLLSEKQYSSAINNFKTILKQYPNDVNAKFYIGFAYYNLNNHTQAIPYFSDAQKNSFDFFYEDAQWYEALSLEENGRFKEAKKLFTVIAKEKGFYARQAAKK